MRRRQESDLRIRAHLSICRKEIITNDLWEKQTSTPLEDIETYRKLMREPTTIITYDNRTLVVPTWFVILCIKKNAIHLLWEKSATIMITNEAIRMLQKHCLKMKTPIPGKFTMIKKAM